MKVCKTLDAVYFDVDNTLVMHDRGEDIDCDIEYLFLLNPYADESRFYAPNEDNILELKRCKNQGRTVVVWTHGGPKWAETVVKALELEKYVDFILPKVEIYVDDIPIEQWQFINKYHKQPFGITVTK